MKRKNFIKSSIGLMSIGAFAEACRKNIDQTKTVTNEFDVAATDCITTPQEIEGPFPYPAGEINNPLNRSDVREDKKGKLFILNFKVVNTNNTCAVIAGARVDIWQCDRNGYYSGYVNDGYLGTKDYRGQNWLRGYQLTNSNGNVKFTTIYPGWYTHRATHIHFEVYINNALKKTGQIAFPQDVSRQVYTTSLYSAHGQNPKKNLSDNVFGNSAEDLANETVAITTVNNVLHGDYTIGIAL